ncbi:MAG: phytoene/squalene synthase family protein [Planctomycetota bacterium]
MPAPPLDLQSSYAAARSLARREARHFYFAFCWLTPQRRDAMCVIYCFLRKLDDLADTPNANDLARADRFAPCRELLDYAYGAGGNVNNINNSNLNKNCDPIAPAFRDAVQQFTIPRENFAEAIAGAEMDLEQLTYKTYPELRVYCHRAASVVGRMCVQVFGFGDSLKQTKEKALVLADELGVAFQLTNILRDLREDAERGRVYLPAEDLERFEVSTNDLTAPIASERLRRLLAFEGERARELYERAAPLSSMIDRRSRRALAGMRAMYRALLTKMERADYDVLGTSVRLSAFEKMRVAARVLLLGR